MRKERQKSPPKKPPKTRPFEATAGGDTSPQVLRGSAVEDSDRDVGGLSRHGSDNEGFDARHALGPVAGSVTAIPALLFGTYPAVLNVPVEAVMMAAEHLAKNKQTTRRKGGSTSASPRWQTGSTRQRKTILGWWPETQGTSEQQGAEQDESLSDDDVRPSIRIKGKGMSIDSKLEAGTTLTIDKNNRVLISPSKRRASHQGLPDDSLEEADSVVLDEDDVESEHEFSFRSPAKPSPASHNDFAPDSLRRNPRRTRELDLHGREYDKVTRKPQHSSASNHAPHANERQPHRTPQYFVYPHYSAQEYSSDSGSELDEQYRSRRQQVRRVIFEGATPRQVMNRSDDSDRKPIFRRTPRVKSSQTQYSPPDIAMVTAPPSGPPLAELQPQHLQTSPAQITIVQPAPPTPPQEIRSSTSRDGAVGAENCVEYHIELPGSQLEGNNGNGNRKVVKVVVHLPEEAVQNDGRDLERTYYYLSKVFAELDHKEATAGAEGHVYELHTSPPQATSQSSQNSQPPEIAIRSVEPFASQPQTASAVPNSYPSRQARRNSTSTLQAPPTTLAQPTHVSQPLQRQPQQQSQEQAFPNDGHYSHQHYHQQHEQHFDRRERRQSKHIRANSTVQPTVQTPQATARPPPRQSEFEPQHITDDRKERQRIPPEPQTTGAAAVHHLHYIEPAAPVVHVPFDDSEQDAVATESGTTVWLTQEPAGYSSRWQEQSLQAPRRSSVATDFPSTRPIQQHVSRRHSEYRPPAAQSHIATQPPPVDQQPESTEREWSRTQSAAAKRDGIWSRDVHQIVDHQTRRSSASAAASSRPAQHYHSSRRHSAHVSQTDASPETEPLPIHHMQEWQLQAYQENPPMRRADTQTTVHIEPGDQSNRIPSRVHDENVQRRASIAAPIASNVNASPGTSHAYRSHSELLMPSQQLGAHNEPDNTYQGQNGHQTETLNRHDGARDLHPDHGAIMTDDEDDVVVVQTSKPVQMIADPEAFTTNTPNHTRRFSVAAIAHFDQPATDSSRPLPRRHSSVPATWTHSDIGRPTVEHTSYNFHEDHDVRDDSSRDHVDGYEWGGNFDHEGRARFPARTAQQEAPARRASVAGVIPTEYPQPHQSENGSSRRHSSVPITWSQAVSSTAAHASAVQESMPAIDEYDQYVRHGDDSDDEEREAGFRQSNVLEASTQPQHQPMHNRRASATDVSRAAIEQPAMQSSRRHSDVHVAYTGAPYHQQAAQRQQRVNSETDSVELDEVVVFPDADGAVHSELEDNDQIESPSQPHHYDAQLMRAQGGAQPRRYSVATGQVFLASGAGLGGPQLQRRHSEMTAMSTAPPAHDPTLHEEAIRLTPVVHQPFEEDEQALNEAVGSLRDSPMQQHSDPPERLQRPAGLQETDRQARRSTIAAVASPGFDMMQQFGASRRHSAATNLLNGGYLPFMTPPVPSRSDAAQKPRAQSADGSDLFEIE